MSDVPGALPEGAEAPVERDGVGGVTAERKEGVEDTQETAVGQPPPNTEATPLLQPRAFTLQEEPSLPPSALDEVVIKAFEPAAPVAHAYAVKGRTCALCGVFLLLAFVLVGWQVTCLFSELCFHAVDDRPVVSEVGATVSFPVGAVLVLVIIPMGYVAIMLQRHRWLMLYTFLAFVCGGLLIVGAIFALAETGGSSLSERVEDVWNNLTFKDRAFFNNDPGELRDELKDDATAIGVLAVVGATFAVFAGCGGLLMLRRQWALCAHAVCGCSMFE